MLLALVFRNVTQTLVYDNVTSNRILQQHYFGEQKLSLSKCDATYHHMKEILNQIIM